MIEGFDAPFVAIAAPFPTVLVYGAGLAFVLLGILLAYPKIRAFLFRSLPSPGRRRTAAVLAAIVFGSLLIGAGAYTDTVRWTWEHTRSMSYTVSVEVNGSGHVSLVLPAPADSRLWNRLNATNGSASLSLVHTADDTYVLLETDRNVTFVASARFVSPAFNMNLTHTAYDSMGTNGAGMNTTVTMVLETPGTTVRLSLDVVLGDYCYAYAFSLQTTVHAGTAGYLGDRPTVAVC